MSTEALQQIAQASAVAAPVGQGLANRAAGRDAADAYRAQAAAAYASGAADETRARGEAKQIIAQQTANAIAGGGADSSAIDVIRQNEVNLIQDALALRARAMIEGSSYESRAAVADTEANRAGFEGLSAAGARLLMTPYQRRLKELSVA